MKVLLAGDWHGNSTFARTCFAEAAERDCPVVLQLGDFGLWPGREDAWLDECDRMAAGTGTSLVWIDGNHENHDWLDRARADSGPDGRVQLRERVVWASRGARWEWAGRRFGALGGAVSIDRFLRRPGVNWWPQEKPSPADLGRLGGGPLDVLVTHAAPADVRFGFRPLPVPGPIVDDAIEVRRILQQAVDVTRPSLVVHGHYHLRHRTDLGHYRVEGLAHDKSSAGGATAVLDLSDLSVADGAQERA